jgi:hypothetical protein
VCAGGENGGQRGRRRKTAALGGSHGSDSGAQFAREGGSCPAGGLGLV